MTNPNWLDESRRHSQVYASTVHPACVCDWEQDEQREGEFWKTYRLKTRKAHCVIHGKNGSH